MAARLRPQGTTMKSRFTVWSWTRHLDALRIALCCGPQHGYPDTCPDKDEAFRLGIQVISHDKDAIGKRHNGKVIVSTKSKSLAGHEAAVMEPGAMEAGVIETRLVLGQPCEAPPWPRRGQHTTTSKPIDDGRTAKRAFSSMEEDEGRMHRSSAIAGR